MEGKLWIDNPGGKWKSLPGSLKIPDLGLGNFTGGTLCIVMHVMRFSSLVGFRGLSLCRT